jgi:hypothetical protein
MGAAMVYLLVVDCDCAGDFGEVSQGQSRAKELIGSSVSRKAEETTQTPDKPLDVADTETERVGEDSLRVASEEAALEDTPGETVVTEPVISEIIRVQVLNGCGVKGIASNVAPALRRMGFDVRESRNAKNFRHELSRIYNRQGKMADAYALADSVGIDSSLVGELADPELVDIDVTIVVGADYKVLNLGLN